jgi:hypothetical protein
MESKRIGTETRAPALLWANYSQLKISWWVFSAENTVLFGGLFFFAEN